MSWPKQKKHNFQQDILALNLLASRSFLQNWSKLVKIHLFRSLDHFPSHLTTRGWISTWPFLNDCWILASSYVFLSSCLFLMWIKDDISIIWRHIRKRISIYFFKPKFCSNVIFSKCFHNFYLLLKELSFPGDSKWPFESFWSPSWRSLSLWKGHLTIPKRSQRTARLFPSNLWSLQIAWHCRDAALTVRSKW